MIKQKAAKKSTDTPASFGIKFGAISDPLVRQLRAQGIKFSSYDDKKELEHLQKDTDAITRLIVRRMASERESKKVRDRIYEKLLRLIVKRKL